MPNDTQPRAEAEFSAAQCSAAVALRGIMQLLDDGDLMRNTDGDGDASVFMRQGLKITQALKAANDALEETPSCRAEIERLGQYERRMKWLHDCSSGSTDAEGYEWGIYRVKWENGRAVSVMQTLSDFSDLDAAMREPPNIVLGNQTPESNNRK